MGRGARRRAGLLLAAASLAAAAPGPASRAGAEAADPLVIEVAESLAGRLRTAPVQRAALRRTVRVPATVELDQANVSRIDAGVNGRVVEVDAFAGQRVARGHTLARLTSPELTRAQVALLGARAEVDLQRRAVQRASELVEAEVIAQAELERRQKELFLAAMAVQSHRDQLRLMGMSRQEIDAVERSETILSEVGVVARADGVVIERHVSQDQVVQPGEPLFAVADLSRMRIEGQAPESEVGFLARADHVQVEIPAIGRRSLQGELLYVGATVNPQTRTVTVRTEIESPGSIVKPKMLATLLVVGPAEERLAVPARAVVRDGTGDHVFVQEAAGRYRYVPVSLEPAVEGLRAVAEGLAEGDVVVVDGAFRLNAERIRRAGL